MENWTFYPAFIASFISVISLTHMSLETHDRAKPRTLSELGASEQQLLKRFRAILLVCGVLFAITGFGFIAPRAPHFIEPFVCMVLLIGGELLAAIISAEEKTAQIHNVLALIMGVGMLGFALVLVPQLAGAYQSSMLAVSIGLAVTGCLTFIDRTRYIFYELPFIYLSHASILLAAVALR